MLGALLETSTSTLQDACDVMHLVGLLPDASSRSPTSTPGIYDGMTLRRRQGKAAVDCSHDVFVRGFT